MDSNWNEAGKITIEYRLGGDCLCVKGENQGDGAGMTGF